MGLFFNKKSKKKYRILSIDGGGMKGVFTAYALQQLEEEYGIKIIDHFDMIVGTSTGALIAAAILVGQSGKEIFDSYMDADNPIFKGRRGMRERLSAPFLAQYGDKGIMEYLGEQIGDHTLDTLYRQSGQKDFAFFASNFSKAKPIIYGSPSLNHSSLIKKNVTAIDVLRTTTSAPFFFEPVEDPETGELIMDGGLWANNPSLSGVNIAMGDLGKKEQQLEVLSFGQSFTSDLNFRTFTKTDVLKNPLKNQFIQLLLSSLALNQNAQTALVSNLLKERLYRYEPEIHQAGVAIDKVETRFVEYAKEYWEENKESLVKFIKTGENTKYKG